MINILNKDNGLQTLKGLCKHGIIHLNVQQTKKINEIKEISNKLARQDSFIKEYNNGLSIKDICTKIGIDRGTYYAWMHKDNEFIKRFKLNNEMHEIVLENILRCCAEKAINDPRYLPSLFFYLSHFSKDFSADFNRIKK